MMWQKKGAGDDVQMSELCWNRELTWVHDLSCLVDDVAGGPFRGAVLFGL